MEAWRSLGIFCQNQESPLPNQLWAIQRIESEVEMSLPHTVKIDFQNRTVEIHGDNLDNKTIEFTLMNLALFVRFMRPEVIFPYKKETENTVI